MENGKGLVYDPNVGQYIDRRGVVKEKNNMPEEQYDSMHGVKEEFHYVRFMKREKEAMTYKLGMLMKEQEEGEKHIVTNEQKEKEMLKGSAVLASNLYKDCALCEQVRAVFTSTGLAP